jgi:hypothetical protein
MVSNEVLLRADITAEQLMDISGGKTKHMETGKYI